MGLHKRGDAPIGPTYVCLHTIFAREKVGCQGFPVDILYLEPTTLRLSLNTER
jgi:hypothetical protein